jgi:hypothetical protein
MATGPPQLDYWQAIEYLKTEFKAMVMLCPNQPLNHGPWIVDVCIYDPYGMCLCILDDGELKINSNTTLKNLVLRVQDLVDRCFEEEKRDDRILVSDLEVRNVVKPHAASLPRIQGKRAWCSQEEGQIDLCLMFL